MDQSAAARLTVAAVARRLGVAPSTLRTWDRRYGLGPSQHSAGAHRRYNPADVERLQTMRRLTLEGVPPGEAARVALGEPLVPVEPNPLRLVRPLSGPLPDSQGGLAPRRGGPGGNVLALPGANATVRGLGRAAMALDAASVTAMLREQVQRHGVLHTWEHVLRPVLVAVGARWARTGEGIEVEHLLSDCSAAVLRAAGDPGTLAGDHRPVLLACAPEDQHALPLHALGAGLAERGVASRTLGPSLPAAALQAAVRRTGPAALFLWSQLPSSADQALLDQLPITRPPTAVLVGGPGWRPEALPDRVTLALDLPHAVALVEQSLGA